MHDFKLWAAASDLLNHLNRLEMYSEPELLDEYEVLVAKIGELSEQLEAFQSEQLRTLHLLGKFVTMRVSAFGEAFEGEPLQALLEIGQHVERELFYGIVADIEPSIQPPEFHLERDYLKNAKPGEREALIGSYCLEWLNKSRDFEASRDAKRLVTGLKVQCGAIFEHLLRYPRAVGEPTTKAANSLNRTKPKGVKKVQQLEFELFAKYKNLLSEERTKLKETNSGLSPVKAEIYRKLSSTFPMPNVARNSKAAIDAIKKVCERLEQNEKRGWELSPLLNDDSEESPECRSVSEVVGEFPYDFS